MTPNLKKLYQETLLRHGKSPFNHYEIEGAPAKTLRNPLCGDEITVYLDSNDTSQLKIAFTAQACSICVASASIMTERLSTTNFKDGLELAKTFVSNFQNKNTDYQAEGELAALSGVLNFPSRIRCATLPWEAFIELQNSENPPRKTETAK